MDPVLLDTLLARWPVGRWASVTPSGRPHVLPVVFVAEQATLYTPVDGKRKGERPLARMRNLAAHGRAELLLDHYSADWSRLWWVRLSGPARVLERDAANAALFGRIESRLHGKYPQYAAGTAAFRGTPTLLSLEWQRVSHWTQSGDLEPIREACR